MDDQTQEKVRAAEEAVGRLIEECRKRGLLYNENPKAVAQVSRTGKWLLNALATLRRALDAPAPPAKKSRQ